MTTTRALASGLDGRLTWSKIWTAMTSRKLNISGVPRSVRAQMNTMTAPAKYAGRTSGNVTRRKTRHGPAPRPARRILQRRVDVGEARHQVQVQDREEVQRLKGDDPHQRILDEPVHRVGRVHQAQVRQGGVQRAVGAEDLLQADRPDERRQDHRHQDGRAEQPLAPELRPGLQVRQRQRQQRAGSS